MARFRFESIFASNSPWTLLLEATREGPWGGVGQRGHPRDAMMEHRELRGMKTERGEGNRGVDADGSERWNKMQLGGLK